ncbi:MAG: hypothetical protein IJ704_01565 [Bacilli bacterium]|nr:hypothetical protein [Bacilli bacterium]
MNTYSMFDKDFLASSLYQKFVSENPEKGGLRIRAYAASEAIPVAGLKVEVSTIFDDNKIIIFDGFTNESGVIDKIVLAAPRNDGDDLVIPSKRVYEIKATSSKDQVMQIYHVNVYPGICIVQTIHIVPPTLRQEDI